MLKSELPRGQFEGTFNGQTAEQGKKVTCLWAFPELFFLKLHDFFFIPLFKIQKALHFQVYMPEYQMAVWWSEIMWPLET